LLAVVVVNTGVVIEGSGARAKAENWVVASVAVEMALDGEVVVVEITLDGEVVVVEITLDGEVVVVEITLDRVVVV
jgi:hypothetical protein